MHLFANHLCEFTPLSPLTTQAAAAAQYLRSDELQWDGDSLKIHGGAITVTRAQVAAALERLDALALGGLVAAGPQVPLSQVVAVVESVTGGDQSGDACYPAPAPALMEQVVADTNVSDWGDGKRCQINGCSQSLLQCNGHVLCAPCLTKWFPSQTELREDANELPNHRRLCPVCKVELREVRGDARFQYGLLKIPETWD